ncbi:MAG: metal-dependent hydrolase [Candidatus Aenigmarchaeota archaeon]|nr:metal-dependent hydrolase [Candidatus Aenigmarchaeota archaeon]
MKVKYLGHSCFLINGELLIDPFISGNPKCPFDPSEIKCKIICVTHDHSDHLGDAFDIAANTGATVVAIHEVAQEALSRGLNAEGMNIGGEISVGEWKIKMVLALHSSNLGHPAGFVLEKDGKRIYHAGDTGLFGDMKLIGEDGLDLALLPIGDRYTMGTKDAIKAVEFLNPKMVIPMHYGTFPIINQSADEFKKEFELKFPGKVIKVLEIGEEVDF